MLPSIFHENLFDDMFDDVFGDSFGLMSSMNRSNPLYGKHAKNMMKTDVRETEDSYLVDIDLPGFKKDEIQVELKDGSLTVSAAKGLDKEEKDAEGRYIRQERYAGQISRSFYVGENIRPEDLHAKYEDGILQLTMPKIAPQQQPASTRIAIE